MNLKYLRSGVRKASICLAVLASALAPAHAAFQAVGNNTSWEYEAPAGFSIAANTVSVAGDATSSLVFTLAGTFNDMNPVTVTFRTTMNISEQFFLMNMVLNNQTAENWKGFEVDVVDFYEAAAGNAFHPTWAHIHPGFAQSSYAPFTQLMPSTAAGKVGVIAVNGTVNIGADWSPTKLRLHDQPVDGDGVAAETGPMQFDLILTPIPEPSTYFAGLMMLSVLAGSIWRHRKS
jgi:ABC-type amino acid transport substrate-binding protein